MICANCCTGGAFNAIGRIGDSKFWHDKCENPTGCDCQHSTGEGWVNPNARQDVD